MVPSLGNSNSTRYDEEIAIRFQQRGAAVVAVSAAQSSRNLSAIVLSGAYLNCIWSSSGAECVKMKPRRRDSREGRGKGRRENKKKGK